MNKDRFRIILNIGIILTVFLSWGNLTFFSSGFMSSRNFSSLKYFTILSNVFEAIVSIIWLWKKDEQLKYIAAVSLSVTFFTVLFFLGPTMGYAAMFGGTCFWLHGAVPIASIAEFIYFDEEPVSKKDQVLACMPLLIYGTVYLGNNLINGIGEWPNTNDWYGFLRWGYRTGLAIFTVMIILAYNVAGILKKLQIHQ